jgi:hypothetical protein
MIEVAQGTPGSGKSAVAVARAIMHIKKGGVVAANFSLVEGWAEIVVRNSLLYRLLVVVSLFSPGCAARYLHKKANSLHRRFYRVDSLASIRKIFPVKESVDLYQDKGGYSEGSGLLLLDECQLIFNSRKWEKNFEWIEFFTQHRKLGWNVVLIAHTIDMIDGQIRPLAEYESRFRNLQKIRIPVLGLPLSPFPLFLVIKRYAGLGAGASVVADRDLFPLPLWAAKLYDSLLVFSADSWGKDTAPHFCGEAPAPPCGVGAFPPVPGPGRISTLSGPHWDDYLQTIPGDF